MEVMPITADPHLASSAVQQQIESRLLERLSEQNRDWHCADWAQISAQHDLPRIWRKTRPDAVWTTASGQIILAEAYARIGELKSGHRRKLGLDALKLLAIRKLFGDGIQIRCLLVVPSELKEQLSRDGWLPAALSVLFTEITPIDLRDVERKKLADACERQARGNRSAQELAGANANGLEPFG